MAEVGLSVKEAPKLPLVHNASAGSVLPATPAIGPPLWLLAELTYRCPLHCVFCYNPVDFARQEHELDTEGWLQVLRPGREMGAVQLG